MLSDIGLLFPVSLSGMQEVTRMTPVLADIQPCRGTAG